MKTSCSLGSRSLKCFFGKIAELFMIKLLIFKSGLYTVNSQELMNHLGIYMSKIIGSFLAFVNVSSLP